MSERFYEFVTLVDLSSVMNKFAFLALVCATESLSPMEQSRVRSLRQLFEKPSQGPNLAIDGHEVQTFRKWRKPALEQPQIQEMDIKESNNEAETKFEPRPHVQQQSEKYRAFQKFRGYN